MRTETQGATISYIPFSLVSLEEQPYRFRMDDAAAIDDIRSSFMRSGQTHPVTLLEVSQDKFLILDGHRRCAAVHQIRQSGGSWEKILAQIFPYNGFAVLDRFRLLREKNLRGENAYSVQECGQFFKDFVALGMSVQEIAQQCQRPPHAVEDSIELSQARPDMAALLNKVVIEPVYALMLHRRFEGWLRSPHADQAETVAKKLLDHASHEKITMKSWKFLLDFYWGETHPFMAQSA